MNGELTPTLPCGCPDYSPERRSARDSDPLGNAKGYLELAGKDWHRDAKHPGPYQECPQQTCYFTNRDVSQ